MKVVSLNPNVEVVITKKEALRLSIDLMNKKVERRLNKKYGINEPSPKPRPAS